MRAEAVTTRLIRTDDAPALAELLAANREFLAPWEPIREDDYFTVDGQSQVVANMLARPDQLAHVILVGHRDGERIVGRITLNEIARGPFLSCRMGYWVSAEQNGRGVATAAVAAMVQVAFAELDLHRIEAGTLLHNTGSQRVLEHNGFTRFGIAPKYLKIAGRWQDHALYQRLAD